MRPSIRYGAKQRALRSARARKSPDNERQERNQLAGAVASFTKLSFWIAKVSAVAGAVVALTLLVAELRESQTSRITDAWQVVAAPAAGRSGKLEALEYLNSESFCIAVPSWLTRIVYSPDPIGPRHPPMIAVLEELEWNSRRPSQNASRRCWKDRVSLASLQLDYETHGGPVDLRGIDLRNADLSFTNFSGALLDGARLNGAKIQLTDFSEARLLDIDIRDTEVFGSNFADARMSGDFRNLRISNSSLDRASIVDTTVLLDTEFYNVSINNAEFSIYTIPITLPHGVEGFSFYGEGEVCADLALHAWAYSTNLPSFSEECLKESVWVFSSDDESFSVDEASPYAYQSMVFELHGHLDFLMDTPDHNGPFLPNGIASMVTGSEELSELWTGYDRHSN